MVICHCDADREEQEVWSKMLRIMKDPWWWGEWNPEPGQQQVTVLRYMEAVKG